MALTEDKTILTYKGRKEKFLQKLNTLDKKLSIVEVADKLQNLISDLNCIKNKEIFL